MLTSITSITDQCLVKDGCKPELQTPETIKLFGGTKKLNVPSLEVVEVVLVQCNLVDIQY